MSLDNGETGRGQSRRNLARGEKEKIDIDRHIPELIEMAIFVTGVEGDEQPSARNERRLPSGEHLRLERTTKQAAIERLPGQLSRNMLCLRRREAVIARTDVIGSSSLRHGSEVEP